MDAADVLYGVSMGGDGVTKVVSRRLPRDAAGEDSGAGDDEDEGRGETLSAAA
jgi:chromosome segregation protein